MADTQPAQEQVAAEAPSLQESTSEMLSDQPVDLGEADAAAEAYLMAVEADQGDEGSAPVPMAMATQAASAEPTAAQTVALQGVSLQGVALGGDVAATGAVSGTGTAASSTVDGFRVPVAPFRHLV